MNNGSVFLFNILIILIGLDVLLIVALWKMKRRKVSISEKIAGTIGLGFFLWLLIMMMIGLF
jgi:hypothetical protein